MANRKEEADDAGQAALWHVRLLGGLQVRMPRLGGTFDKSSGDPESWETVERFRTRRGAQLLAYLVYHAPRKASREGLAEMLWPDAPRGAGRDRLKNELATLRRQFHLTHTPHGTGELILTTGHDSVEISPRVQCDTAHFLRDATRAEHADEASRFDLLLAALAWYQEDLLPGFEDDWIVGERERLRGRFHTLLGRALLEGLQPEHPERLASILPLADRGARMLPEMADIVLAAMEAYRQASRYADALALFGRHAACLKQWDESPAELIVALRDRCGAEQRQPATLTPFLASPIPSVVVSAPPTVPLNVPLPLPRYDDAFVGREEERGRMQVWACARSPLLTLVGVGGVGKTRLALEAARQWGRDRGEVWGDGKARRIVWVACAGLTESEWLADATLRALNLSTDAPGDAFTRVREALCTHPHLLILDNLEQLPDVGARCVEALLDACPDLRCLVTSRRAMQIARETRLEIAPLATDADAGQEWADSVRLFEERARQVKPDYRLTARTTTPTMKLCRLLDGLPLAIELAAVRSSSFTPAQMLTQMEAEHVGGGKSLLRAPVRAGQETRHRSLDTAISWSYQLLPPLAQRFFARLSVLRGGFTAESAALCVEDEDPDKAASTAGTLLALLAHHSMAYRMPETREEPSEPSGQPEPRWRLLETLRQFAAARLAEDPGEQEQTLIAALCWMEEWGIDSINSMNGEHSARVMRALSQEQENFRAFFARALETADPDSATIGLLKRTGKCVFALETPFFRTARVAAYLSNFHQTLGRSDEGLIWVERFLNDPRTGETNTLQGRYIRSMLLRAAGRLARGQGEYRRARTFLEESVALERRGTDTEHRQSTVIRLTTSLKGLAFIARFQGEYEYADNLMQEVMAICERENVSITRADNLLNRGMIALDAGRFADAAPLLRESVALHEEMGLPFLAAIVRQGQAHLAYYRGDWEQAARLTIPLLQNWREHNNPWGVGVGQTLRARIAMAILRQEEAVQTVGDAAKTGFADALEVLADGEGRVTPTRIAAWLDEAEQTLGASRIPVCLWQTREMQALWQVSWGGADKAAALVKSAGRWRDGQQVPVSAADHPDMSVIRTALNLR